MPKDPKEKKRDVLVDFNPASSAAGGHSWFFGIGINKYEYFPALNNAVKDVQDMSALLLEEYDFSPEHTITIFDEEATREHIIEALDRLQREVGPNDKLLIYYSGHGHYNKAIGKGYWIPTNAERDNTAEYLRNSTVREYMETLGALHTLLISDSCFSGSLFVRGATRSTAAIDELRSLPSRWAICSGRHDEEVFDGEPGENSPFAESIMDTLRRNAKREFNVAKLVDRVIEQTRSNYNQLPEGNPLYGVGHKGGQYIFRRRAVEAEDWADAQAADTLPAYRQFLENHPNGQQADNAREKIAFLEEEEAWEEAKDKHTVLAYFQYNKDYPDGRHQERALELIRELEEESAWREAQRHNKLSAYWQYVSEYPEGKYRKEADARIEAFVESQQKTSPRKTKTVEAAPRAVQPKEEPAEPARGSTPAPSLRTEGTISKWLPIAAGALLLILGVVWGISKISGESKTEGPDSGNEVKLGGKTYPVIRTENGTEWLAQNLNVESDGSWCYNNDGSYCKKYGRLYTWGAAKAACKGIGMRLPTDDEWEVFLRKHGKQEAYQQLIKGGTIGFGALLGGYRSPSGRYADFGASGAYWSGTKTEQGAGSYYYFGFDGVNAKAYREKRDGKYGYSCRCVKE